MAYLCAKCIKENRLVESNDPVGLGFGRTGTCEGFCEACQPVFFGWKPDPTGKKNGWPQHTIWVPAIVRSLDDPEAIPRQLAVWAAKPEGGAR